MENKLGMDWELQKNIRSGIRYPSDTEGETGETGETGDTGDTGDTGETELTRPTVLRHDLTEIKPKMGQISNS